MTTVTVTAPDRVTDVASIIERLIWIGKEDAEMTVKDGAGDLEAAHEAMSLHIKIWRLTMKDEDLTPDQLSEKYDPDGYGQHPDYTRADWRDEVRRGHTLRGYWDWVSSEIEQAVDEEKLK